MFARCPDTYKPLEPGQTTTYNGNPLLPGWEDSVTHCVVMAGARASGKSLYLAVLIKQLELMALQRFTRVTIKAADESTRQRYKENYERPLYEEMKHMAPTPTSANVDAYQRDPFIFKLGKWPDANNDLREHYLVIRDVAGEDLENPNLDPNSMEFFRYADLVIFLFDPTRVRSIAPYLEGMYARQSQTGGEPERVLDNIARLIGDERPKLAVTIAKFDILQSLAKKSVQDNKWKSIMANEGAAFSRDTGWSYQYHNQWILHLEIQSLLRKFEAHELLNTIEELYANEPSKYSYFAVSALGEAPKGQDLDRKGIAPYRVLDPVRWHLGRFGVLMGKEDTYQ